MSRISRPRCSSAAPGGQRRCQLDPLPGRCGGGVWRRAAAGVSTRRCLTERGSPGGSLSLPHSTSWSSCWTGPGRSRPRPGAMARHAVRADPLREEAAPGPDAPAGRGRAARRGAAPVPRARAALDERVGREACCDSPASFARRSSAKWRRGTSPGGQRAPRSGHSSSPARALRTRVPTAPLVRAVRRASTAAPSHRHRHVPCSRTSSIPPRNGRSVGAAFATAWTATARCFAAPFHRFGGHEVQEAGTGVPHAFEQTREGRCPARSPPSRALAEHPWGAGNRGGGAAARADCAVTRATSRFKRARTTASSFTMPPASSPPCHGGHILCSEATAILAQRAPEPGSRGSRTWASIASAILETRCGSSRWSIPGWPRAPSRPCAPRPASHAPCRCSSPASSAGSGNWTQLERLQGTGCAKSPTRVW